MAPSSNAHFRLTHQAKQGVLQEHVGGRLQRVNYLDVTGPILPDTVCNLCRLFKRTQNGDFGAHLSCIDSTVAFNFQPDLHSSPTEAPRSMAFDSYLVSGKSTLVKQGLQEITCKNGLYSSFS